MVQADAARLRQAVGDGRGALAGVRRVLPELEAGGVVRQIDGVIWAVPEIGDNRQWLLEQVPDLTIPLVFLTMHPLPGLSIVSVDNYSGARLATEHLLQQGYHHYEAQS